MVESPRFTDGSGPRYESKREIKYDSTEVSGVSNWMHRVATIETGETGEKKKLVNANQEFSLHMLRL